MNNHGTTLLFSKIYILHFTNFNGMLNKNAKQNKVNSMWREGLMDGLRRLHIYKICDVFLNISQYSQENTCVGFSF